MTRVLITQRFVVGPHGDPRDALEHAYVVFFEQLGFTLIPVPNAVERIEPYVDTGAEAIILSGGNDIHPTSYGSTAAPTDDAAVERDRVEHALLSAAVERGLPVLGICRGMQFINVFFGGSVCADFQAQAAWLEHRPGQTHSLDVVDQAAREWLRTPSYEVNSYHRQAVMTMALAPRLACFAVASTTNVVEGIFHPDYPIAGIQYHPERRAEPHPVDLRLIDAFRTRALYWGHRG